MRLKYCMIIVIITMSLLLLTACKKDEIKEINRAEDFVKGFKADDSMALSTILTKEYKLRELKDFFGEISSNETLVLGDVESKMNLTIRDVDKKFPIECLRKNGYSVYKVSEGGYFYVFWIKTYEPNFEGGDTASVYFTAYLSTLRKASDFDPVRTAEDVAKIDPAFELSFVLSSKTPSYSLLSDGTMMEICYVWNDTLSSRSDLVVQSKEVISKDKCPSRLATISSEDLPCHF